MHHQALHTERGCLYWLARGLQCCQAGVTPSGKLVKIQAAKVSCRCGAQSPGTGNGTSTTALGCRKRAVETRRASPLMALILWIKGNASSSANILLFRIALTAENCRKYPQSYQRLSKTT